MGDVNNVSAAGWQKIEAASKTPATISRGRICIEEVYINETAAMIVAFLADLDASIPEDAKPFVRWTITGDVGAWLSLDLSLDADAGRHQPALRFSREVHLALGGVRERFISENEANQLA